MLHEIDRLVGSQEFANILDISTRTLAERIKSRAIPPPDRPAKRLGEGHKWLLSTVRRVIESPRPASGAHQEQSAA
jgi:hypothetical protein